MGIGRGTRILVVLGAMGSLGACAGLPSEPRYSIYADPAPQPNPAAAYPTSPQPTGDAVRGATDPAREAPPPMTAPVERIEGGALGSPMATAAPATTPIPAASTPIAPGVTRQPAAGPASEGFSNPPPVHSGTAVTAGASYEIQPGDTLSGVGRRFRVPVQSLIDLNALGPRGAIAPGQRLVLPEAAVDAGRDPYATGPSPTGVYVPETGVAPPPPPPPPSGNVALPPPPRQPAATAAPASDAPATTSVGLDWPVRGDILRRFGPVGMGERNNGINIGASAGTEVKAAAAGRVGYVGDDLAGQGLTVLVVHRDGWRSVYGHLGSATVHDGDAVTAGQSIGTVGTTAGDGRPSIHFETWRMRGDEPTAVDPLSVLPR